MAVARPLNPFLSGGPYAPQGDLASILMAPQPISGGGLMQLLQSAPQRRQAAPQNAMPTPPQQPTMPVMAQSTPAAGLGAGLKDFLGSDAALAFAAGALGGGSTSQALGRGLGYALQAKGKKEPATTDDLKEYAYAKREGYKGTFTDFMKEMRKAGATSVDARQMGTIPPGYRAEYDEQGRVMQLVPIPGGPEDKSAAESAAREAETRAADIVTQDIDRAIGLIESAPDSTTGMGGALLKNLPGTTANNVRALIDTVKANVGFDKLQAMRAASPTGGALGQVSERENALLQATIGNLEQSQTTDQLRDNLNRVWNVYQDIIHGPGNGPPRRPIGSNKSGWTVTPVD